MKPIPTVVTQAGALALGAAALAIILSSCAGVPAAVLGGLGSAGSAYLAVDKLTEAVTPYIVPACAEYARGRAAAEAAVAAGIVSAAAVVKVRAVESFGDAACAHPPAGDPLTTAIWLGRLAGQLTATVR